MKKMLAAALAASMVMGLTACGGSSQPTETKAPESAKETEAAALAGNYAAYIYDVSLLVMMIIASVSLKEKISGLKIAGAVVFISSLYLQIMW